MRRLLFSPRLLIAAFLLLLGYTLAGFLLLPYVIKAYVLPAVSDRLHRPVVAKEVEVNPFTLSLRIAGFEIRETDQAPLLGFEEFFINFQTVSLFRQAYVFETIRLTMPFVSVKV